METGRARRSSEAVDAADLPRQNLPLNLPTKRRLCSTVGGRIVDGWVAHRCAVSTARSRTATMTNLARSSLAFVLPALFGAAKSCALVNVFMICPRWPASSQPTTTNSASDHGHLMALAPTLQRFAGFQTELRLACEFCLERWGDCGWSTPGSDRISHWIKFSERQGRQLTVAMRSHGAR